MFVSREHHPQLLAPDCYLDQVQFDQELLRLFHPGWHCVGVQSELPHDGAFRTLELFGNPILLWRKGDEVHAFLNVCAHRSALLTNDPCGRTERLKCQYHGWEYDETGNVRKIPDARSFRPLEPGLLGLKKYHAAQCGQAIFISLADDPPPLADYLGAGYDVIRSWFSEDLYTAVICDREIPANWKLLVENALESYHTAEVHPKTFGDFPAEEACEHELTERWTSFTASYSGERSFRRRLDDLAHRWAGVVPTHQYQHVLFYPNVMLSRLSLYKWFECVIPLSPTRSRSIVRVLCNPGNRPALLRRWNAFWVARWARSFLMQVGSEDAAVLPSVQQGVAAPDRPLGGLISTREERIFHFQRYIQNKIPAAAKSDNAEQRAADRDDSSPFRTYGEAI